MSAQPKDEGEFVEITDEEWAMIVATVRREAIRQQAWPLGSSYQQQYLNRPWVPMPSDLAARARDEAWRIHHEGAS